MTKHPATASPPPVPDLASAAKRLFGELAHLHGLTKSALPALAEAAETLGAGRTPGGGRPPAPWSQRHVRAAVRLARRPPREVEAKRRLREAPDDFVLQTGMRLAALLRLAAGLRGTGTEAAQIDGFLRNETGLAVTVVPAQPGYDTQRALGAADLWNAVLSCPVTEVRALDRARRAARRLIAPESSLADALRAVLERQLDQFASRAYGAGFAQDPEYVHELRVASRRMRSALRVFRRALDGGDTGIKTGLQHVARVLGEARDTDVFLVWLTRYAERRAGRRNVLLHRLIRREQAHRRRCAANVRACIRGPETARLLANLRRLHAPPGAPDGIALDGRRADTAVAAEAPRLLAKRRKAVLRFGRKLDKLSADELHALRIACKRLRYGAEFLRDVYPAGLNRVIRPATRMQDFLGNVHDADVYAARIGTYLERRRKRAPEDEEEIEALYRALAAWRDRNRKAAAVEWRRFCSPRQQRAVALLLAAPYRASCPRAAACTAAPGPKAAIPHATC